VVRGWRWWAIHGEQESPEGKQGGGSGARSGVGETAKAQEEWFAGVFVVLMRVGVKTLASCSELSTATARWRPSRASGGRGSRGGGQQGRGTGLG
jgi:hypothetical protein